MLVDTFYNRIRTTQAVSRTFVISRLSDYFIFIALGSFVNLFESDSISAAIAVIRSISAESTTLAMLVGESTEMLIILFSVFVAASCKCAQFVLFV